LNLGSIYEFQRKGVLMWSFPLEGGIKKRKDVDSYDYGVREDSALSLRLSLSILLSISLSLSL